MEKYDDQDDPFAMGDTPTVAKPIEEKTSEPEAAKPAEKKAPVKKAATDEEKKPAARRNTMAYQGKPVGSELPQTNSFPAWPQHKHRDDEFHPDEELDFSDLSDLNREINRARARSYRVKDGLADARREETEAQEEYRKAYNRALVGISGGSAETRKAMAEIATEDLYSNMLIKQTIAKELTNLSYTVSRDLDTLKTISDNLRKQLSI